MSNSTPRNLGVGVSSKLLTAGVAAAFVATGLTATANAQDGTKVSAAQKGALTKMASQNKNATISVRKLNGKQTVQVIKVDLTKPSAANLKLATGNKYKVRLDVKGAKDLVQTVSIPKSKAKPRFIEIPGISIGDVSTAPAIAALPQAFDIGFVQISPWDSYIASDLALPQVDQWQLLGALFDQTKIPGLLTEAIGSSLGGLITGALTNLTTVMQYSVNDAEFADAPLIPWANHAQVMQHGFGLFHEKYRKRQVLGGGTSPVTERWVLSIPIIGLGTLTNLLG